MQIAQSTRDCVTLGWWENFAATLLGLTFKTYSAISRCWKLKCHRLKHHHMMRFARKTRLCRPVLSHLKLLDLLHTRALQTFETKWSKHIFLWQCRMNSYPLVPIVSMRKVQVWKSHDCPFFPFPQPDQSPPEIVPFLPAGTWVRRSKHEGWSVGALA